MASIEKMKNKVPCLTLMALLASSGGSAVWRDGIFQDPAKRKSNKLTPWTTHRQFIEQFRGRKQTWSNEKIARNPRWEEGFRIMVTCLILNLKTIDAKIEIKINFCARGPTTVRRSVPEKCKGKKGIRLTDSAFWLPYNKRHSVFIWY